MKICPQCRTRYQDDTLSFCLDDGTPLVAGPQSDTPTVVLGETETYVARSGYQPQPSEVTRVQSFEPQQPQTGSKMSGQPSGTGAQTALPPQSRRSVLQ